MENIHTSESTAARARFGEASLDDPLGQEIPPKVSSKCQGGLVDADEKPQPNQDPELSWPAHPQGLRNTTLRFERMACATADAEVSYHKEHLEAR